MAIVLILQTVVIIGLLRESRRRRRADVAAREHLSELARMNRLAEAGELSTWIAHEIKQPLSAIATNAGAGLRWLGRATPDLGETRAALERIVGEAHRATDVIEAIRATLRRGADDKAPLDVNGIIRDVLTLLRADLEKRRISVETDLSAGLPKVVGSAAQLQQVILNVITNAAEAMDSVVDRPRALRIASARPNPEDVVIDIGDSGGGIDPQNLKRIFNPFFTTKSQRMGMGLPICRSIIDAHGGYLSASLGEPLGLALRISLPAGEAVRAS